ncbi:MAG: NUDIX domain-containing protein [Actinobacteria bacterium]|nr:NUDIX domain-containing protein [Actinomycetota bacterium]
MCWAAGILLVAVHDGVPVMLLGRDHWSKGGKWSDFAGGGEAVDWSPEATALRELDEETGGAVRLSINDLAGCLRMTDVTPSGKTLHRFVVRVPYDPKIPLTFRSAKDQEKTELRWFPMRSPPPLRRVFWHQLHRDGDRIMRHALGDYK